MTDVDEREPIEEEESVELEVVDALPVPLAEQYEVIPAAPLLPAAQTAAVAATGFLAGAVTLALLHRRNVRRLARELQELRDRLQPARTAPLRFEPGRSYLVHVRVLSRPPAIGPHE